jgi:hypothetical protein
MCPVWGRDGDERTRGDQAAATRSPYRRTLFPHDTQPVSHLAASPSS